MVVVKCLRPTWLNQPLFLQAVKDISSVEQHFSDSEEEDTEGEELLKDVRDRKQSKAAADLGVSVQEEAFLQRLHAQTVADQRKAQNETQQDIPTDK